MLSEVQFALEDKNESCESQNHQMVGFLELGWSESICFDNLVDSLAIL